MHPSWSTATYTLAFKEKALKSRQGVPGYQSDKIGPLSNLKENVTRHQRRGGWSVTQKLGKEQVPGEVN